MTKVLVTGGAGLLGSEIAEAIERAGFPVVVLDDLSRARRVDVRVTELCVGDFADYYVLDRVMAKHPDIDTVIHCAAYKNVAESVHQPSLYHTNNVLKTQIFLDYLERRGILNFILSSSAAVYGGTADPILSEFRTTPKPESPYAWTKLYAEGALATRRNMRSIAFRYFNPITPDSDTVVGALLQASRDGTPFRINGTNWGTSDGTPVRDFIDIRDLARAHVTAVQYIGAMHRMLHIVNLGSGIATPIGRLASMVSGITGKRVEVVVGDRREGDIRGGAADIEMARALLNWMPRIPQGSSVAAAWDKIK